MMMKTRLSTLRSEDSEGGIDLQQVLDFVWRRAALILGVTAAVVAITLLILITITPRYTATAQILLDPRKENVMGAEAILSEMSLDNATVDSQVAVLQSRALLRRVVESRNLVADPEFGPRRSHGLLAGLQGLFRGKAEETAERDASSDVVAAIGALQGALQVARVGRTYVLAISITSVDREKAAVLANAVADAYIVDQLEARYDSAKRASQWLSERLESLRAELRASEDAVEQFRTTNNLIATGTGALNEQQLSELNAKLVAARTEAAEKRAKLDQAREIVAAKGNIQAVPDVMRSPVVQNLRGQQAEVSRREADLVARYGDRHPAVINVRAERRDVERAIAGESERIVANLQNDFSVALASADALERNLRGLSGQAGVSNNVALKLRELERLVVANRTLYENFLSRTKLSEEQSSLETREARIISPANPPGSPSYPKKPIFGGIGLVLGLGAGLGAALLLEGLRRGFSSPSEVESLLDLPTLASVPQLSAGELTLDGTRITPPTYLLKKPLSRYSEAVRSIRAGIQMADVDNPAKLIQITSAVPGEGKSTIAVSLALSSAASGANVLLLDADLRHPTTTKAFDLIGNPGLVEMLTGEHGRDLITVEPQTGLHIMGAGRDTQTPADLLISSRMRAFLEDARQNYDYVFIDSPPVGPVVDGLVLSQAVDKVVFILGWESTPREIVSRAVQQFPDRKIAGIVLNHVDVSVRGRYGEYYYDKKYYSDYYDS